MKQFGDGTARLGVPDLTMGVVDVRDVARAHIQARDTGWWWIAMDRLQEVAELETPDVDRAQLRDLVIRCRQVFRMLPVLESVLASLATKEVPIIDSAGSVASEAAARDGAQPDKNLHPAIVYGPSGARSV